MNDRPMQVRRRLLRPGHRGWIELNHPGAPSPLGNGEWVDVVSVEGSEVTIHSAAGETLNLPVYLISQGDEHEIANDTWLPEWDPSVRNVLRENLSSAKRKSVPQALLADQDAYVAILERKLARWEDFFKDGGKPPSDLTE